MSSAVLCPVEVRMESSQFFNPVNQQAACSPDGLWALMERCWRMVGSGQWEGWWWPVKFCHLPLCAVFSSPLPPPPPPHLPTPALLQSPTGSMRCLVMKGLSNGSFLYPSPTKLVWQLFPLPRPASTLSLSGSECILNGWISLQSRVCACMRVLVCTCSHACVCFLCI